MESVRVCEASFVQSFTHLSRPTLARDSLPCWIFGFEISVIFLYSFYFILIRKGSGGLPVL